MTSTVETAPILRSSGDILKDGIIKIVKIYIADYEKDSEAMLKFLGWSNVGVGVMMTMYNILIAEEAIEPLESLDADTKNKLWATAMAYVPKDFHPEPERVQKRRWNFCKCLWLINAILES